MEFLYEYGLFLVKAITIVVAIGAVVAIFASAASKQGGQKGHLEINDLSELYKAVEDDLVHHLLTKEQIKSKEKKEKQEAKADKKNTKGEEKDEPRVFVVNFKGSIDAKEVTSLREEISAILMVATPADEVFVRLETGGGMVHGYGLAASQLDRVRQANVPLTVAVDKVAASGGYMMACVANKIIAAPFAILGSIGVIAQIPNFHKILKKNDVDFEQITAGEFKRTLTMFGENTDKGREKFTEEIEEIHQLFKDFVIEHRPQLDINQVATGETWFGTKAQAIGLVDEISTSDDYLYKASKNHKVVEIKYEVKKGLAEKLSKAAALTVENVVGKIWQNNRIFPG